GGRGARAGAGDVLVLAEDGARGHRRGGGGGVPARPPPSRAAMGGHARPSAVDQGAGDSDVSGLGRRDLPGTTHRLRPRLGQLVARPETLVDVTAMLEWLQRTAVAVQIRDSLFTFPV